MNMHQRKHARLSQAERTMESAAVPDREEKNARLISAEDIRLFAYRKWESAGKPAGDGVQFWLEAEREMVKS